MMKWSVRNGKNDSIPKNEYEQFLEAMSYYHQGDYTSAYQSFKPIQHLPHFRTLMTKPFVHTNIALKQFHVVYEWIEESLVIDDRNEDELIEWYIYTMIQEKKYGEAIELIHVFLEAVDLSYDLRKALLKLKNMATEFQKKDRIETKLSEIAFSYQRDLIDFILQIDRINIETHEPLMLEILQDAYADPFVKYQLLELLHGKGYDQPITYVNGLKERFTINPKDFVPIGDVAFALRLKLPINSLNIMPLSST